MMNDAVLLDKGIKCLTEEHGMPEAGRFIRMLKSRSFAAGCWRTTNPFYLLLLIYYLIR
jgi:hypothetical protein